MCLIVQVIDASRELKNVKVTSLAMMSFLNFLGVLRACASIAFSKSLFGYQLRCLLKPIWM